MDYKRLVSYIYAYNKGEKDKNVGFAKVESRSGQCKILINLKGIYTDVPEAYKVYLFARKDSNIIPIELGNTIVKNGVGNYEDIFYESNINNSGYSLDTISGILIGHENDKNNMMASQWDDEEINLLNIVFGKEKEEINEKQFEKSEEIEEVVANTETEDEVVVENIAKDDRGSETSIHMEVTK